MYKVKIEGIKIESKKKDKLDEITTMPEEEILRRPKQEQDDLDFQRDLIKQVAVNNPDQVLPLIKEIRPRQQNHLFQNSNLPLPALPDGRFGAFVSPPWKIISEEPPQHRLEYYSYRISINTKDFPERVFIEIRNPLKRVIHEKEKESMSPKEILSYISGVIVNDLQR